MNSYKRLQEKNKKLQQSHRKLFEEFVKYLEDPTSAESLQIKARIEMEALFSRFYSYGGRKGLPMGGLLDQLAKNPLTENNTFTWNITDRAKE